MQSQITRLIEAVTNNGLVSPFIASDLSVPVEVSYVSHGDETTDHRSIQWVTIPVDPELPTLIRGALESPEFLNEDVEEVWHADCPVRDTGLVADSDGAVSRLIDSLRSGLTWPHQIPSLDKVIWSKRSANEVSGFHTDHFPFGSATRRSRGSATRVIVNLGSEPRVVCFLLPNGEGRLPIGDDYCPQEYQSLEGLLDGATLLLASLPPLSQEIGAAGVRFDAHNVLHSGLPYQGALVAVITDWRDYV